MTRLIALLILFAHCSLAQLKLEQEHYTKLVVPEGIYAEVWLMSLKADTLIMEDNSSLRFVAHRHALMVNRAIIRGAVKWEGVGKAGDDEGDRGEDGVDLILQMTISELDRLLIDTRGGAGAKGRSPTARQGYINMANPGKGGNGGDGGDVQLSYRCIGFTPQFNKGKRNAIHFKTKGGAGGAGGFRNAGGSQAKVWNGPEGEVGDKGKDGLVLLEDLQEQHIDH